MTGHSMAENVDNVLIGSRGWLHSGWQHNFYPDDLPQDWQLAYYSNEFSMVVIREQEWMQIEDMADLQKECPEDFQFLIEWPVLALTENLFGQFIDRIQQLGRQCAGVIIPAQQEPLLVRCRSCLPETIPCYFEGTLASETNGLIKVSDGTNLKELRGLLESAMRLSASSPVRVIVEGEPPEIELLRNAETLLGLL